MARTLGVVVLYFPDHQLEHNISTYIEAVDGLIMIDNSSPSASWVEAIALRHSQKIKLIKNGENLGIAKALNQALAFGLELGYDWLLTMDQDSSFETGAPEKLKNFLQSAPENVALVTPVHLTPQAERPRTHSLTRELYVTMTSGNLLRLSACQKCGPFDEKLFIDSVDHEYCLRLRKNGYRIIRLYASVLFHRLGEIKYRKWLFLRFKTTNHSSVRRYYIFRNRLYVMRKYFLFDQRFFWREFRESIKGFFLILLLEEDKLQKLRAAGTGAWHFLTGRMGRR